MTREEILIQINAIFCTTFDDDSIKITETTSSNDIEEWDSLEHINLILTTEKKFGVKFTISEVTTMKDVGAMIDIIIERM